MAVIISPIKNIIFSINFSQKKDISTLSEIYLFSNEKRDLRRPCQIFFIKKIAI